MRLEMQTQTFNARLRTEALTVLQIHTSVFFRGQIWPSPYDSGFVFCPFAWFGPRTSDSKVDEAGPNLSLHP